MGVNVFLQDAHKIGVQACRIEVVCSVGLNLSFYQVYSA